MLALCLFAGAHLVASFTKETGDRDIERLGLGGHVGAGGCRAALGQPREQRWRLALVMPVVVTIAAVSWGVVGGAGLAAIEVGQRFADVVLDDLQLCDLLAALLLLLGEQRTYPRS